MLAMSRKACRALRGDGCRAWRVAWSGLCEVKWKSLERGGDQGTELEAQQVGKMW